MAADQLLGHRTAWAGALEAQQHPRLVRGEPEPLAERVDRVGVRGAVPGGTGGRS
jgi:hypothetical protein